MMSKKMVELEDDFREFKANTLNPTSSPNQPPPKKLPTKTTQHVSYDHLGCLLLPTSVESSTIVEKKKTISYLNVGSITSEAEIEVETYDGIHHNNGIDTKVELLDGGKLVTRNNDGVSRAAGGSIESINDVTKGRTEKLRDLKRAQEASEDIISNSTSQISVTKDCDDGSRLEEHLVVPCSNGEIVKYPTQPVTTEISREDGSNFEIDVLTVEEADITGLIMAVEDEPLMMLGSHPHIIKEDFSNDLDGQHSTYETALRAQAIQELYELQMILALVDSRLLNIEQFLNNFTNETNMNDLESDDESVDTPLISPFPHSDNDSDDGEVLNELIEKFTAYFDPFLPINIITRKAYNTLMVEGLESTGKNLVAVVRDVYVFVGSFTYITDFVVLEDLGEFILIDKAEVMAISVISVLSDSSKESVRTSTGRVILFGIIPTTIPDITPSVTPPTTHIDTTLIPTISPTIPPLPDYTPASPDYSPTSDTESDPSKDPSSDHIPPLPATSPFLSSTDDSLDNDIPDTPPSPTHGTPFTETTLSTQSTPVAFGALRR
ncbi:hypothetical protein Tco_0940426 [Tanacetum coccineum]|uniref:Reverse transcriptase domain-containing protein n=1 Tax=Tanacetum coccineum TaxID=301880 RepID=A0ABQ5DQM2_9ASTR